MNVVVPPCSAARPTCSGPAVTSGVPSGFIHTWCRWTCGSIPPGITIFPVASITRAASPVAPAPTVAIVSPATARSPRTPACGGTTPPPRTMRSNIAPPLLAVPTGLESITAPANAGLRSGRLHLRVQQRQRDVEIRRVGLEFAEVDPARDLDERLV